MTPLRRPRTYNIPAWKILGEELAGIVIKYLSSMYLLAHSLIIHFLAVNKMIGY